MLDTFTLDTFQPHVDSTFRVFPTEASQLDLALSSTSQVGEPYELAPGTGVRRAPFSLLFYGPANIVLPQRIYKMEHDQLGAFELFLVPLGPDPKGMRYEAIFT